jgi:Ca2+-binding RTX toxin-like protein
MDEAVSNGRRHGRSVLGAVVLLLVASLSIPALDAAANHADNCGGSEPGPNNGPTVVLGTSGDDRCLVGANGPDSIKGKGGDDALIGNHGRDILRGGPGNDRFWGGRGPDTFICGPGFDRVHNRRDTGNDLIDESCEIVR